MANISLSRWPNRNLWMVHMPQALIPPQYLWVTQRRGANIQVEFELFRKQHHDWIRLQNMVAAVF